MAIATGNNSLRLHEFLQDLDAYGEAIPVAYLEQQLRRLVISREEITPYLSFGKETYKRNLLHDGGHFQALLLCWRSGHRSPIHDHRGSACGVRVLEGVATETVFDYAKNGMIFASHSKELRTGEVCASVDSDIHQVSNLQEQGRDLITLHVYSPALLVMGQYSLIDGKVIDFEDPIQSPYLFCDGGGI
ncbi:MAG: cysteine dioxygenase family protein [Bdellovibrionales bacterium]|nr:cysteine dioxygenase family protein [Bdellovibrionales bacterium]